MLQCYFYIWQKRAASTSQPAASDGTPLFIELKQPTDILRPQIIVGGSFGAAANRPYQYNYLWIPEFERFYFIDNWEFSEGRWVAFCHVDVLATYKLVIGASTQYVLRASSAYDGRIKDTMYPITTRTDVLNVTVAQAGLRPLVSNRIIQNGWFVVGFITKGNAIGTVAYYMMNNTQMAYFRQMLMGGLEWTEIDSSELSENVQKLIMNPFDYVVSCKWFPIDQLAGRVPHGTNFGIPFGFWSLSFPSEVGQPPYRITPDGNMCLRWVFDMPVTLFGNHPQAAQRGEYLNAAPYRQYMLSIAPYGNIELPFECAFSGCTVVETVDLITGACRLRFLAGCNSNPEGYPRASTHTLLTVDGVLGVDIQLGQVRPDLGAGLGVVMAGEVANGVANLIPDNSEIKNTITSVKDAAVSAFLNVKTQGSAGGFLDYTDFTGVQLTCVSHYVTEESTANYGRPLCQNRRISTLSSYIKVGNPQVVIDGTKEELDEILRLMADGFYYE